MTRTDQSRSKTIEQIRTEATDLEDELAPGLSPEIENQINEWRKAGPLQFWKDCYFTEEGEAAVPWPWQEDVLKSLDYTPSGKIKQDLVFISTGSRLGKSFLCRVLFAWMLTVQTRFYGIFLSESKNLTHSVMFDTLQRELSNSPILREVFPEKEQRSEKIVNAYTDSYCELYPQKVPIGLNANAVSISELWRLKSNDIVTGSMARVATTDGTVLIDSLKPDQHSEFSHLLDLPRNSDGNLIKIYEGKKSWLSLSPLVDETTFNRIKAASLKSDFEQQILNFGTFKTDRAFEQEILTTENYDIPVETAPKIARLLIGLDRSRGRGDPTALVSVLKYLKENTDETHYQVCNTLSFDSSKADRIVDFIETEYSRLGLKAYACLEDFEIIDLVDKLDSNPAVKETKTIPPSGQKQREAFLFLRRLLTEGKLHISNQCEPLISELQAFEYTPSRTGGKFGGAFKGKSKGPSDDLTYALTWAIYGSQDVKLKPKLSLPGEDWARSGHQKSKWDLGLTSKRRHGSRWNF